MAGRKRTQLVILFLKCSPGPPVTSITWRAHPGCLPPPDLLGLQLVFKGALQVSVYFCIHLLNMHMEMHYNYNTLGSTHITIYNINIQTEKQAFLLCILLPRAPEATTSSSSRRCVLLEASLQAPTESSLWSLKPTPSQEC